MRFRFRHIAGSDAGFSLVELMVVTSLLGVVLGAAYMVIGTVTKISDQIMARESAQSSGQLAVERMTREIRQAQLVQSSSTGQNVYFKQAITGTSIIFFADVDHNGWLDKVTYSVVGGKLIRTVANSNRQLAPTSPDNFGSDSAPQTLATVDPSNTTIFTPEDANGQPTAAQAKTTAIQVTLSTIAKSGLETQSVDFPPVWVEIRSYGPGYGINQ